MSRFITIGQDNWHSPHRRNARRIGAPVYATDEPHPVARMIILAGLAASVLIWFV